jgi:hypothetical protein
MFSPNSDAGTNVSRAGIMLSSIVAAVQTNPDLFSGYTVGAAYDEMFEAAGQPRPHYRPLYRRLQSIWSGRT